MLGLKEYDIDMCIVN